MSSKRWTEAIDGAARELRGVIASIRFRSEASGFTIATLKGGKVVKGALREPAIGLEYLFRGRWVNDPRWGLGFVFDEAGSVLPTTEAGVRDYLRAHAPWVGPEVARAMLEAFGDRTLEILKHDPERVAEEIRGITLERAEEIQKKLLAIEEMEAVEVALRGLVGPAGVTTRQLHAILERYGREAAQVVRRNPYRLVSEIDGVGWLTADKIGRAVGIDLRAPERVRAGLLYALSEAESDGHTCMPKAALIATAAGILGVAVPEVEPQVRALLAEGDLATYVRPAGAGMPAEERIYRGETFDAEALVADSVLALLEPADAVERADERADAEDGADQGDEVSEP